MEDSEGPTIGGKRSAWMSHVKKTMKANKGKSLKQVLKMAGKTYKKVKKGGANGVGSTAASVEETEPTVGGRRRRRGKSSRRTRRR